MVAQGTDPPPHPGTEESRALLRACFAQHRVNLLNVIRGSLEQTNDLFETHSAIPDGEVEAFRNKRGEWLDRFDKTLCDLFERRVNENIRRKGRRPDADASAANLRVLSAFDHERQVALKEATRFLDRFTQRELAALDLRIETILGEDVTRDVDNPFAVSYILDAVGSSARSVYPNPRVWRPFMERLLTDLTPEINKLYISLNRFLADRGVLPEIKAALRARSGFRPQDDRELLPTFSKMLHDARPDVPQDVVVPDNLADPNRPPALVFADEAAQAAGPARDEMSAARILAGLAALAAAAPAFSGTGNGEAVPAADPSAFPSLDPLMALGTSSPLFAALARFQRVDLPAALVQAAPASAGSAEGVVVPLNLIPHIRAAIEPEIKNDTDRITMDVIALLFDYIFRDRSIPDDLRSLFGRLQVPILKAALLDRTFFSDRNHAARQLLDSLADAAVGATQDAAYLAAFSALATGIVEDIARDFEVDLAIFRSAQAKVVAFVEEERRRVNQATAADVQAALGAEEDEADRAHVRAFLRDRLAGLEVPFEVRGFVDTTWADYLAALRRAHGADSEPWRAALATLDDLLWSIVAKERSAQKTRLTKMIPTLVGALRKGCAATSAAPERSRTFFEALYQLHIAAIKSAAERAPVPVEGAPREDPPLPAVNVHDYVSEMAVGTWLCFTKEGTPVNARLTWVSPLRTKYLFTSRSRSRAFVYTPEELAYEIGKGDVALVVEPVPLFDRAVSAALDSLGARQPAAPGATA